MKAWNKSAYDRRRVKVAVIDFGISGMELILTSPTHFDINNDMTTIISYILVFH
jgi:hypothetical protein